MRQNRRQSGASLIVSLIMLVVVTLLVVSAIRAGNSNLRIAGNMQAQTEAAAAVQQAIEQTIDIGTIAVPNDFTQITAPQTIPVTMGAVTYSVAVAKPVCENTVPLMSDDPSLSQTNADDKLCFGDGDPGDIILDANGNPVVNQTKCNLQNWQITATATESGSGASATLHQGVAKRVYTPSPC